MRDVILGLFLIALLSIVYDPSGSAKSLRETYDAFMSGWNAP